MKEAAGEANMTVITIVLIAVVLGIGTVIVTNMMNSSKNSSECTSKGNVWYNGTCYTPDKCSYDATTGKQTCS